MTRPRDGGIAQCGDTPQPSGRRSARPVGHRRSCTEDEAATGGTTRPPRVARGTWPRVLESIMHASWGRQGGEAELATLLEPLRRRLWWQSGAELVLRALCLLLGALLVDTTLAVLD